MKKLIALLMTLVLAFSLCACGAQNTENKTDTQDSYEQNMRKEMKKYTGKWVESYGDELQDEDIYIYLFEDGVYMIFNISASDYIFDFDELDLEHHGNTGTWDVRNNTIFFYSTSDGGRKDVHGYDIIDENTIEIEAGSNVYLKRVETY